MMCTESVLQSGRTSTSFMRQLVRMFHEESDAIVWDRGCIVIPSPSTLEKILPKYYRTSKFASFQRQLNNFGYHRTQAHQSLSYGDSPPGVRYHKVTGSPPVMTLDELLYLRPLARHHHGQAGANNKRNLRAASTADPRTNNPPAGGISSSSSTSSSTADDQEPETRKKLRVRNAYQRKDKGELEHAARCLLALDRQQQEQESKSKQQQQQQQPTKKHTSSPVLFSVTTVALPSAPYHSPHMPVFTSQLA